MDNMKFNPNPNEALAKNAGSIALFSVLLRFVFLFFFGWLVMYLLSYVFNFQYEPYQRHPFAFLLFVAVVYNIVRGLIHR